VGIQVLGPLAVDGSGRLNPRDRVVLQALTIGQGQPVTADELADALWGDSPPVSAHKNLQSCIMRLRKVLGPDAIETSRDGYRLAVPTDEIDARRFEAQVERARGLLEVGEADRVAFLLEQALQLWRGTAFADLSDWHPARVEAGRLDELRLEAEELQLDAQLRRGRAREVLARAHELVHAAPLRERRWELLALAQYRSGAQADALRSLRQLRALLTRELGIDPGPALVALEQSILQQDPSLLVPVTPSTTDLCPWLGLRSYDVDDAERFFGRETHVADCLAVLATGRFLALAGPSGSGKSSLLRAGVLAALGRRGHRCVLFTPGPRPMEALSKLPVDAPETTVLAVDQAEEVFALCDDVEERRTFLERLADEARRRPVLVAIRGDRLSQVTEHAGFSRLVEQGLHLVGALDDDGLRAAIEQPARQAGLVLEPGLVELLVREVRDDPGALPLLSHALVETWQRREGNTLTVEGYHASGGIHGAVAQSAELLYSLVETDQRPQLRDLVLRLVSPGVDGEPVRARVPRRLIADDTDHDRLIEMLVDARLVTADEGVLEITHEALARAWPRLRGWLEDDVEGQQVRHHLSGAADSWDALGRPASELYRGVRLTRALDWRARTRSTLTRTEEDFLDAARAASEAEEQTAVERAREQARLISRLRQVLVGAVVLLLLAAAGGGIAVVQWNRAGDNAAAAADAEVRAVARRAGASALATGDIDTSLLLAVAGVRMDPTTGTRDSLLAAITKRPELFASTPLEGDLPLAIDASADGRFVAVLDESRHLRLHDGDTGELLGGRQLGEPLVTMPATTGTQVTFSPDGRWLAVARTPYRGRPLDLLAVPSLTPVGALEGLPRGGWRVTDLSFSGDGSHLAAGLESPTTQQYDDYVGAALVWDLDDPASPRRFSMGTDVSPEVALDEHGDVLFTSHPLTRRSVATGASRLLDPDDRHFVWSLEVLDGGDALFGLDASIPRVFDAATGRVRTSYPSEGYLAAARVAPDGRRFLVINWEGREVTEWRLGRHGQPNKVFSLDRGNANAVDYSADGNFLFASGRGATSLRRWDLTGEASYVRTVPTSSSVGGGFGVIAADGQRSVVLSGEAFISDYRDGSFGVIPSQQGYRHTYGAFHPDGEHFLTAIGDTITVWDGDGRATGQRAVFPSGRITELDYTPDGSRLVVSELDGTLSMLDGESLERVGTTVEMGEPVSWIVARPDGHTAVVLLGGVEPSGGFVFPTSGWALVDLVDGVVVRRGKLEMRYGHWLDVSPDGSLAVVGGGEYGDGALAGAQGEVEVIDLGTGRRVARAREWGGNPRSQVVFSPDGTKLLSSSPNGLVAVWDVGTVAPTATLVVPGSSALSGAFLADGRTARVMDWATGQAYDWDLSPDTAVEFACRAVGRDLTLEEWREHFGDLPFRETCPQ
jgi:DNA-binding SARP family transcriptional activator/WD40 repeat protein